MAQLFLETFPDASQQPSFVSAADPSLLAAIAQPRVKAAIWARRLPRPVEKAAKAIAEAGPFTVAVEAPPDKAPDALIDRAPTPLSTEILHDVRVLAVLFGILTGRPNAVRIRLSSLNGPGCWRWHADAVGLRLLCTYSGPGTEIWTASVGMEAARHVPSDAIGTILPSGAAAILKGEAFPGNSGAGCIHRSPQNAGPRLLLCLDEPGRIPCE